MIQAEQIFKYFGNETNRVIAVEDLNLTVEAGAKIAIVGRSGSGKTTLLNLLSGLDRPTSGRLVIEGRELSRLNQNEMADYRLRCVGVVLNFQNSISEERTYLTSPTPLPNAALETALTSFTSSTGSTNTHYVLFANSYSNGGPLNTSATDPPLTGGLTSFSASGLAITPNPGSFLPGRLRTIMATGDGVTAVNETNLGLSNASSLPTVLAHELGHNGSLRHINGGNAGDIASEHYDPTRADALMWTSGGASGSENVLSAGEIADTLRTMDINGTLALVGVQTGTFWDSNGAAAGYGGDGIWGGANNNWGRPTGEGITGTWVGNEVAVFRAGGAYNVTVSGTQTATGIALQVGDATFNSIITGGGTEALTKLGAGTLILNGANTYTGGNQIRRGQLQGNSASIQGDVNMVNGGLAANWTILNFNQGTTGTFAGDITGTGSEVRKTGAGTLTLSSANLSYTGVTNVNDGLLNINGSKTGADDVNVAVAGALGGTGSIAGDTTVDGSLDLRDSMQGVLNFTNNLLLGGGAMTFFEFSAGGIEDQVDVAGMLTLDGQIIFSNLGYTFANNDTFDLFDWGTVDFSSFMVSTDLDPFLPTLGSSLLWDSSSFLTDGSLTVVAIPEPGSTLLLGLVAYAAMSRRRRVSKTAD